MVNSILGKLTAVGKGFVQQESSREHLSIQN